MRSMIRSTFGRHLIVDHGDSVPYQSSLEKLELCTSSKWRFLHRNVINTQPCVMSSSAQHWRRADLLLGDAIKQARYVPGGVSLSSVSRYCFTTHSQARKYGVQQDTYPRLTLPVIQSLRCTTRPREHGRFMPINYRIVHAQYRHSTGFH